MPSLLFSTSQAPFTGQRMMLLLSPSRLSPACMAKRTQSVTYGLQAVSNMYKPQVACWGVSTSNNTCGQEPGAGDPELVSFDCGGAVAWTSSKVRCLPASHHGHNHFCEQLLPCSKPSSTRPLRSYTAVYITKCPVAFRFSTVCRECKVGLQAERCPFVMVSTAAGDI